MLPLLFAQASATATAIGEPPIYWWIAFCAGTAVLLMLDMFVFHRHSHEPTLRESAMWTVFWCSLALMFNVWLWTQTDTRHAIAFFTGYLVEWCLSMDNVFVFVVIFAYFGVPLKYQYRVLFWGILGAILMRLTFILVATQLIARFEWILYLFGAFLIYTGIKLATAHGVEANPDQNIVLRLARRFLPVSLGSHGDKFFVRENERLSVTPLFLVLLVIESTDVVFAIDSVPAILGITKALQSPMESYIVFTSNVFAIMGLRALYFLLAGVMGLFRYLSYGLSAILIFIGAKMLVHHWWKPEPWQSLLVIVTLLAVSVGASLAADRATEWRRAMSPAKAFSAGRQAGRVANIAPLGRHELAPQAKGSGLFFDWIADRPSFRRQSKKTPDPGCSLDQFALQCHNGGGTGPFGRGRTLPYERTLFMVRPIQVGAASRATQKCPPRLGLRRAQSSRGPTGFTLVEMLVAMAITLVMMAAVATLFANVSSSVRNRRATIEMTNQMRHVRNVLQQDLAGATCPGLTWQRPESNHGYIEIIEGQYKEMKPSLLTDGVNDVAQHNPELDPALSIIPRNNLAVDANNNGRIDANEWEAHYQDQNILDGNSFVANVGTSSNPVYVGVNGLGDYDDILMLTVRNENEPFLGRRPTFVLNPNSSSRQFDVTDGNSMWEYDSIESPLAEVVWFAIENPDADNSADRFFGEPGLRTIYRRTLLIAPWVNPYSILPNGNTTETFTDGGKTFKAEPGLVRLLPDGVEFDDVAEALAALTAFQERYDLSVRLEWDPNISDGEGRWKIMANTLGDLTKRENRYGHYGYHFTATGSTPSSRLFPYAVASMGRGYQNNKGKVVFQPDPDVGGPSGAVADAHMSPPVAPLGRVVESYAIDTVDRPTNAANPFAVQPFAYVDEKSDMSATTRAMLNDAGEVVRVVHGPVPLSRDRRGEDVMLTDALAFDLRVYDPGAPLYRETATETIVEPSDVGWLRGYHSQVGNAQSGFTFVGQGAYVDLGYAFGATAFPTLAAGSTLAAPWFPVNRPLSDVRGNQLAPGYSVYDTWSYHYENNGRDDDGYYGVDQGINGIDDIGNYIDPATGNIVQSPVPVLGIDDAGERESHPPYDKPLRGAQVIVRAYERDSRAIRQIRVSQHFMSE